MRVIAGSARRMLLKAPEGLEVRPTIDRHREMIFNTIQYNVVHSLFLDLFSGSGAMGIEALSRGARKAIFVENSPNAIDCIERNLKQTKLIDNSEIIKYDYSRALQILEERGKQFEFIFMDPPYNKGFEAKAIILVDNLKLLKKTGTLICESDIDTDFLFAEHLDHLKIDRVKAYKSSKFTYFKYKA